MFCGTKKAYFSELLQIEVPTNVTITTNPQISNLMEIEGTFTKMISEQATDENLYRKVKCDLLKESYL